MFGKEKMIFTSTAMPRPEIAERCFKSFSENLVDIDTRDRGAIYINIDPFPYTTVEEQNEIDRLSDEVIDVCEKYFRHVVFRKAEKPNFTKALKWVWSQTFSKTIVHIEEDWILNRPIEIYPLIERVRNQRLYQLVFRALDCRKYGGFYPTNCLSPSIFHSRYYKAIAKGLDVDLNPEHQMHRKGRFDIETPYHDKGKYIQACPDEIIVEDIGREWLKNSPYKKPDSKKDFLGWETKEGFDTLEWLRNYDNI